MSSSRPKAPIAKRVPVTTVLHGETRVDDYAWLRKKDDPEVVAYLAAEDAYAEHALAPTKGLRETLYAEMLGRIQETDLSVPYRERGYWLYSRTEKGRAYPILCRKKGSLAADEEVVLDLNALAEGRPFFAVDTYEFSDDGSLLLYSTDVTGFREYTLRLRDLRTGLDHGTRIERVSSAAWAADGRTVFYVTDDDAKRPYRLWRRTWESEPVLLHEERDERFTVGVHRSRSDAFVFASIDSHTQSEVRYLDARRPHDDFRVLLPRRADLEYDVDHGGDRFYLRINDRGRNFRLVTAPVGDPSPERWEELVPHRSDVMLRGVDVFESTYVVHEAREGLDRFRIVDLATGAESEIEFPERAYAISPTGNASFDATAFRYRYESPITPPTIYERDLAGGAPRMLKRTEVLGGYDPARYAVERIAATAADGTRVPITLAYRRDRFRRDGTAPAHLVGYGSYGIVYPAAFSSNKLSLMDRGMVVAIAHVRGGGEMGKTWHDAGRMAAKGTTFTDFVACAEHLARERWVDSGRIVAEGGSAGGLLMGAAVNLRPDLFRAVVLKVPFVDVVNTMSDASLPLTVGEFEEWGNPRIPEQYAWIRAYCPYSNLKPGAYPALLVKTSTEDSQVMYWEPAKYVAKLRPLTTSDRPILLKVNFRAGHGGASGRYDALRETALDYAFVLTEAGIPG